MEGKTETIILTKIMVSINPKSENKRKIHKMYITMIMT